MFVWSVLGAFGVFWTVFTLFWLLCSGGRGVLLVLVGKEPHVLLAARRLHMLRRLGVLTCPVAAVVTGPGCRELARETDYVFRVSPLAGNEEKDGDRTGTGDPAGNDPGSDLSK